MSRWAVSRWTLWLGRVPTLLPALVLLSVVGAVAGCGDRTPPQPLPDPATLPVPDPDLGDMEPALRQWLTEVRAKVVEQTRQPGTDPAEAGQAFGQLGQLYQIFGFLDAAETGYDNAHQLLPETYRWTYLLATVYLEKGSSEAAEQTFVRALDLEPDSLAAHIRLGTVRLDLNRPQEARGEFERALELDPESAAALYGLGRVEAALDHPRDAVDFFERALRLQPQASVIRYPLAQAYRKLGQLEEAQRNLERRGQQQVAFPDPPIDELTDVKTLTAFQVVQSLAASPDDFPAEDLLGFALTHLGGIRGTVEPLERVIAERSAAGAGPREQARLHYVAGGLLAHDGDDAGAVEQFRAAVELEPGLLDAQVKLGNALARVGRLEEAGEHFSRALELDPGNREIRLKQITVLLNQRRTTEAIAQLREMLADDAGDVTARIRLAEALEASGRRDAAAAEYRQAIAAGLPAGDLARIHRAYGAFFQRQGRLETAVEQYEKALELDRDLVGARRELAPLLGHLGRFEEAASQYAQVVAAQPEDGRAWLGEAMAWILDGDLQTAANRLGEAVAALPDDLTLAHLLARLLAAAPAEGLRQGSRALALARSVYEGRPTPSSAETVAMAYAELGRWNEAVDWQRRAVDRLRDAPNDPRAAAVRARLALYEARRPFRVTSPDDLLAGVVSSPTGT